MDRVEQLQRLGRLRDSGALSDAEFEQEKAELLATPDAPGRRYGIAFPILTVAFLCLMVAGLATFQWARSLPSPSNQHRPSGASAGQPLATEAPQSPTGAVKDTAVHEEESDAAEYQPRQSNGRCLLQVKGATLIQGACGIDSYKGGSFTIYEHRGRTGYFAMVQRDGAIAQGYWSGSRESTHAQDELGELTRRGACWQNVDAKVCAWSS